MCLSHAGGSAHPTDMTPSTSGLHQPILARHSTLIRLVDTTRGVRDGATRVAVLRGVAPLSGFNPRITNRCPDAEKGADVEQPALGGHRLGSMIGAITQDATLVCQRSKDPARAGAGQSPVLPSSGLSRDAAVRWSLSIMFGMDFADAYQHRRQGGPHALDSATCMTANTANTEVAYVVAALSPIITAVRRRPVGDVRNRMSIANRTRSECQSPFPQAASSRAISP